MKNILDKVIDEAFDLIAHGDGNALEARLARLDPERAPEELIVAWLLVTKSVLAKSAVRASVLARFELRLGRERLARIGDRHVEEIMKHLRSAA